jgi:hypothetical protein
MDPVIKNILDQYQNQSYVFKSCQEVWIVVLERTANTTTNEARKNVYDPKYAMFRGSEFMVKDIIHKFDPDKKIEFVESSIYPDDKCTYIIGDIVKPDKYNHYINKICAEGIHFFNSHEPAFHCELYEAIYTGMHMKWYDNGKLMVVCEYKDGYKYGTCMIFHENGMKQKEYTHVDGEAHGEVQEWYDNGRLRESGTYLNGRRYGIWKTFHLNGEINKIYQYE